MKGSIHRAGVAVMILLLLLFCPIKVMGAELSDVSVAGIDVLTEEQLSQVQDAIERIPDHVIRLFQERGGKLIFQKGPIMLDGNGEVLGAYWPSSHKIMIRTAPEIYEGTKGSVKKTIFHEYGHFIYQNSVNRLSAESRKILENTYHYYKKYDPLCSDPNETFACVYSWYYGGMAEISTDMQMVIKEAESLCISDREVVM